MKVDDILKRHWLTGAVIVLLSMLAAPVWAGGNIRVVVTDVDSHRPITESDVTIISRDGQQRTYKADETGELLVQELEAGLYEVRISHPDYFIDRQPSVRVVNAKTTPLNIALNDARGNLEEMLVQASKTRVDVLSAVSSTSVDREALRSAAGGGGDVLRSLDGLPGLFSGGEFSSYTVRGNGPRNNLILVDGIPFADVVHFSDAFGEQEDLEGGGRYSVFAPNVIAEAKFQPGGWGPGYGGQAGSLLQLDVAEANNETPSSTVRFDVAGLEVGYDGPSYIHDKTSVLFSARSLDFTQLFETIGLDDLGEPRLTDIIVKTTTQLTNDKFNFLLLDSSEDYLRTVKHVIASDEDEIGDYANAGLAQTERSNRLWAFTWEHLTANDGEVGQRLYHRSFDEEAASGEAYPDLVPQGSPENEVPVRPELLLSTHSETEMGYRLDYRVPNMLGYFSTGLRIANIERDMGLELTDNWIRYTYNYYDSRPSADARYIELTPETTNNQFRESATNYTLYVDQQLETGDWEWRAGLRYDQDNFANETLFSPRLGATWLASQNVRITATAGRYHQAPDATERASDASNADLKNELVDQLSVGFAYSLSDSLELFVEPYYQSLTELIVEQDGTRRTLANTGEGRSYGLDTALTRVFDNGWSADVTYSYNDSTVKDSADGDYYDADFGRPHSMSVGGIWEANARWKISSRWKYASGRPSDSYVVHENVLGDDQPLRYSRETVAFNTDRYDSYNSLNVRVDYRRAFGRTNVIAFVDVINLLGSSNPSNTGFNERSGEDIAEEGSAVPVIGFRLEW